MVEQAADLQPVSMKRVEAMSAWAITICTTLFFTKPDQTMSMFF